jgi:LytS/YehU family sensor histidine kinase
MAVLRATPGLQDAAAVGRSQTPFLFSVAVILYLLVLSMHYVALAYEAARSAEHQQFELRVLTRDAELRALRAQLNPHFLYNSLNSISALTTIDPEGARRMCVLLGDFLRKTLKVSALDSIPLADELALVDAFIGIEQVRFGARLTIERQIDASALRCRVPPLLLQPLVENAVAHGISALIEGGTIVFTVAKQDGRVLLRIENPRDPDVAPRRRGGVGLENVRRRVQTAFPDRARIDAAADAASFRVELNLPCIEE